MHAINSRNDRTGLAHGAVFLLFFHRCSCRRESPAVAENYAPGTIIGVIGSGKAKKGKGVVRSVPVAAEKGDAFASLEEWGDRRMEESQHPGGELAILISAGKDSTAEFDVIHPTDVVEKWELGSRRLLPLTKVIQVQIWKPGESGEWRLSTARPECCW